MCSCVCCSRRGVHAGEQAELLPGDAEIERVLGVSLRAVEGMDKSVRQVLGADTSAISTLRCLKLYLERLGSDFQNASELQRIAGCCCCCCCTMSTSSMNVYLLPVSVCISRRSHICNMQPVSFCSWCKCADVGRRSLSELIDLAYQSVQSVSPCPSALHAYSAAAIGSDASRCAMR